jgi:hypothetical protein
VRTGADTRKQEIIVRTTEEVIKRHHHQSACMRTRVTNLGLLCVSVHNRVYADSFFLASHARTTQTKTKSAESLSESRCILYELFFAPIESLWSFFFYVSMQTSSFLLLSLARSLARSLTLTHTQMQHTHTHMQSRNCGRSYIYRSTFQDAADWEHAVDKAVVRAKKRSKEEVRNKS